MNTARTVLKNTSVLFAAEALSKAVSIAYVAVLARYIHVSGMGEISTAQALSATLIVLVRFGFSQLIIRDMAAQPGKASSLVTNVLFLRLALAVLYGIIVWLTVRAAHYPPELATIIYLYAASTVLSALVDISFSIFQAFEQMQYVLVVSVFRDVLNAGLSLLAIYQGYSLVVIVAVSALASVLQVVLAYLIVRGKFAIAWARIDLALCRRLFVAAIPFAAISSYYLATYSLNTLVLSVHRSIAEVGAFGAASNLITMLLIIPTIFMRAIFPVFARMFAGNGQDSLRATYERSYNYLLILGMAISAGIFVTGDHVMRLVYGAGFEQAVPAIKILAWALVLSFVGNLNANLLIAMGRERFFMITEGLFALLTGLLSLVLTIRFGYLGSCVAIVAPMGVTFVFYSLLCHRMVRLPLPIKTTALATLAGLIMAACSYLALQRQVNLFAVILLVAPVAYLIALYVLRVLSQDDIALLRQALRLS